MSVDKKERALLLIQNLATFGRKDLKWLYQFLDASGVFLVERILSPQYGRYKKLEGANATKDKFIGTLKSLGSERTIKAIDVILNLHGGTETMRFANGRVDTTTLKNELLNLKLDAKLRILYSTVCYGASHADDFVAAGFTAASGAIGVNASSALEYPIVLTSLANNRQFKSAIEAGDIPFARAAADKIAKWMGFANANSRKTIIGNGKITISSVP